MEACVADCLNWVLIFSGLLTQMEIFLMLPAFGRQLESMALLVLRPSDLKWNYTLTLQLAAADLKSSASIEMKPDL